MDTNMIAISEPTHAAIRFYSDERRKVEIISTKDIENFNGKICFNEPYYVKRYDNQKNNFHLSPAEVLSVGSEEHLLNKKGRYKFSKKRHSDALQQLRLKMEEKQKTSKKNIKIMKQKLKKLGKAHNGKQQLEKFLSNRKCLNPLSDNDEDTTDHSTHEISPQPRPSNKTQSKKCTKSLHNVPLSDNNEDPTDHSTHEISPQPRPLNETQSKKCTKFSHNVPLSDNDEDTTDHSKHEISPQPRPSNETQSKKCTKSSHNVEDLSLEDENDQSVMLQKKRKNLERTKISLPGRSRHSEDESDTENNESGNMLAKQSRIFENQEDDTNHNDNQRITETPRHRPRFRRNKVYRLKLQGIFIMHHTILMKRLQMSMTTQCVLIQGT
ncbi:uncharacterized protein [Temnothorax nylanderi]|uniref:uncharacterized protein isoform X2 n=1 Tax=Temnothorax nylanderi TaxID=102681 RepID=UPI003A84ED14